MLHYISVCSIFARTRELTLISSEKHFDKSVYILKQHFFFKQGDFWQLVQKQSDDNFILFCNPEIKVILLKICFVVVYLPGKHKVDFAFVV